MLPYIIFISLVYICYCKNAAKTMLFIMIVFAVLRYDTGWDYASYQNIVFTPKQWGDSETTRFTWIWRNFFELCYLLKTSHLAICLPNILTYIAIYWGLNILKLSSRHKVAILLVYICWPDLYLGSFSTIRQALAIGLGFLVFSLIQRQKYIWSVIVYLFAVQIHPSAIILILLYPVYIFKNHLNFKTICIASIFIVLLIISMTSLMKIIQIFDQPTYEIYLQSKDTFGKKIIYVNLFLTVYLLFTFKLHKNWSMIERQSFFMTIIALVGNTAIFYAGLSNAINRIFTYYMVFISIILLPSLDVFKEKKLLKIITSIILVAYFCTYLLITEDGAKVASSGFLPYKCILFN